MNGCYWVRFGNDGHWVYTVLKGNGDTTFCQGDYFKIDPLPTKPKQCQVGGLYEQGDGNVTLCSDQHSNCDLGPQRTVLIRHGTEERAYHRFARLGEGTIKCTDQVFLYPHSGQRKHCNYQEMKTANVKTEGKWLKSISCEGKGCPISHAIEVGTTRSDSWSTGNEWGAEVGTSIEGGFKIFGVGSKVDE